MNTTTKDKVPEKLRPYVFYGVELDWEGKTEPEGVCPFCGGDRFHISKNKGLYNCKQGGCHGNIYDFMRALHAAGDTLRIPELSKERGIPVLALKDWGFVKSPIRDEWLIPGHNVEGKLTSLYRWAMLREKKTVNGETVWKNRKAVIAPPGLSHQMFGMGLWKKENLDVHICEGPWDGPALYGDLKKERKTNDYNVVSIPGINVFKDRWLNTFKSKNVKIYFDNDHPKRNKKTGITTRLTWMALEKIIKELSSVSSSIEILRWGKDGYDPELPDGYDVRDFLNDKK